MYRLMAVDIYNIYIYIECISTDARAAVPECGHMIGKPRSRTPSCFPSP